MIGRKIFAGGRVRRLRQRLDLSQSRMAADLGVSPSYLNLIERNLRPLTVQVLLKLSATYGIDVAELSAETDEGTVEALREIFADPLLAGEVALPSELSEFAETAPNAARGLTRLFEAYREALEQLSDLSHALARNEPPAEAEPRLPTARVAAYFEDAGPIFPALEAEAEALANTLSPRDDPAAALKAHLKEQVGVELRILPDRVMPTEQLRYDRHSLRLFLSERVRLIERPFLVARQIAFLAHRPLLDRLAEEAGMTEPETARICRNAFAARFAAAVLAPAERLASAARETGFDVALLSQRFALPASRVATRLAALGAVGMQGLPPAFMITLDPSGAVTARVAGAGFPLPRRAPPCPRLPVFDRGLSGPTETTLVLPDGSAYRAIAFADEGPRFGALPPPRRATLIGWRVEGTAEAEGAARPVGMTCRLCERSDCAHRLAPPVAQPSAFHEHVLGPSAYELAG